MRASKSRFKEAYGKYSGILIDILYDHFLALKWSIFTSKSLYEFVIHVHDTLKSFHDILPDEVKAFVPAFINNDWLNTYKSIEGIEIVLDKMSKRTSLPDETRFAIQVFREEYDYIEEEFLAYFPTLMDFVTKKFGIEFSGRDITDMQTGQHRI